MFYLIEQLDSKRDLPVVTLRSVFFGNALKEAEKKRQYANSVLKIYSSYDAQTDSLGSLLASKETSSSWIYYKELSSPKNRKIKRVQILLDEQSLDIAKQLGAGNVSAAVRNALVRNYRMIDTVEKTIIPSDISGPSSHEFYYAQCIPDDQKYLLQQQDCELNEKFLGSLNVYEGARSIVGDKIHEYTIIDLGCYMASQCFIFKLAKSYIGVDNCVLQRFSSANTTHYQCDIEQFIKDYWPQIKSQCGNKYLAICSYVSLDNHTIQLIKKSFNNLIYFYHNVEI